MLVNKGSAMMPGMGLLDDMRRAIETSGKSRYRIAQESGVPESGLSRLVNGQTAVTIETAERIAETLGLTIELRRKRRRRKGR